MKPCEICGIPNPRRTAMTCSDRCSRLLSAKKYYYKVPRSQLKDTPRDMMYWTLYNSEENKTFETFVESCQEKDLDMSQINRFFNHAHSDSNFFRKEFKRRIEQEVDLEFTK